MNTKSHDARRRKHAFAPSCLILFAMIALMLAADAAKARANAPNGITLALCEDQDEWPPYLYGERINGKKTSKLIGYSVDVIDAIFSRHNIHYSITMLPWVRCLGQLQLGTHYQLALNLSHSEERDTKFLLTNAYYSTTSYYYYSRKHHAKGLDIASVGDLKRYGVCGIHGYNYTTYGFTTQEMDQSAKKLTSLLSLLRLGRCDLFIEKHEVLLGYHAIGEAYLDDPDLGRGQIPGLPLTHFHMAVSRNMPQAAALKDMLDRELTEMAKSGQLAKFWNAASNR
jgi:polar amino acid transport system substrate-binding protein